MVTLPKCPTPSIDALMVMPIPLQQRLALEKKISDRLTSLKGEWEGTYHPLDKLSEEEKKELVQNHVLYKDDDS